MNTALALARGARQRAVTIILLVLVVVSLGVMVTFGSATAHHINPTENVVTLIATLVMVVSLTTLLFRRLNSLSE